MKITLKQNLLTLFALLFASHVAFAAEMPAAAASTDEASTDETSISEANTNETSNASTSETNKTGMTESMESKNTETSPESTPQAAHIAEATEEMAGFSRGTVARSVFTTLIDNREPVDKVQQVPQQKNDIIYFTELRDMAGQTAKHRWEFKGKIIAEVNFRVRGPRWRVWSKKSFAPGWSGDWKVSVVNGVGEVISEEVIAYAEPTTQKMSTTDAIDAIDATQTDPNLEANKLTSPEAVSAE